MKLSISGKAYDVEKQTLCHVAGSALEALFSGRHALNQTDDGRYFIGRNPHAFELMIDFIRNSGQLYEE